MYIRFVEWKEGEIQVLIVNSDDIALKIVHSLSHYLSVVAGYRVSGEYIEPLWELECMEPRSCYMSVWLLDKSTVAISDSNTVKRLLKKLLKLLDAVEVEEELRPLVEKLKEYMKEVVKEAEKSE